MRKYLKFTERGKWEINVEGRIKWGGGNSIEVKSGNINGSLNNGGKLHVCVKFGTC